MRSCGNCSDNEIRCYGRAGRILRDFRKYRLWKWVSQSPKRVHRGQDLHQDVFSDSLTELVSELQTKRFCLQLPWYQCWRTVDKTRSETVKLSLKPLVSLLKSTKRHHNFCKQWKLENSNLPSLEAFFGEFTEISADSPKFSKSLNESKLSVLFDIVCDRELWKFHSKINFVIVEISLELLWNNSSKL